MKEKKKELDKINCTDDLGASLDLKISNIKVQKTKIYQ